MLNTLYVIHDRKADIYEAPVASQNDATLLRWFQRCVENVPTMSSHPEDFSVYSIGTFDSSTGLISSSDSLLFVCSALDCINNIQKGDQNGAALSKTKVGDDSPIQPST